MLSLQGTITAHRKIPIMCKIVLNMNRSDDGEFKKKKKRGGGGKGAAGQKKGRRL